MAHTAALSKLVPVPRLHWHVAVVAGDAVRHVSASRCRPSHLHCVNDDITRVPASCLFHCGGACGVVGLDVLLCVNVSATSLDSVSVGYLQQLDATITILFTNVGRSTVADDLSRAFSDHVVSQVVVPHFQVGLPVRGETLVTFVRRRATVDPAPLFHAAQCQSCARADVLLASVSTNLKAGWKRRRLADNADAVHREACKRYDADAPEPPSLDSFLFEMRDAQCYNDLRQDPPIAGMRGEPPAIVARSMLINHWLRRKTGVFGMTTLDRTGKLHLDGTAVSSLSKPVVYATRAAADATMNATRAHVLTAVELMVLFGYPADEYNIATSKPTTIAVALQKDVPVPVLVVALFAAAVVLG
jgi:hypothetical protein